MSEFDFDELDKAVKGVLQPASNQPASEPVTQVTAPVSSPVTVTPTVIAPSPVSVPESPTVGSPAERRSTGRFMDIVPSSRPVAPRPDGMRPAPTASPSSAPVASPAPIEAPEPITAPLESPFLPDAKVEKRPLGSPETEGRTPSVAPALSIHEELEAALREDAPVQDATTLPDPLVFAETSQQAQAPVTEMITDPIDPVEVTPSVSTSDLTPPESVASALPEATTPEVPAAPEAPVVPLAQASISQQYIEQPSSSSEASAAIYNPDTLHQPLLKAGKKHSGVWTVLWIILLVLLGAAAGGAFYWFVLPLI